MNGKSDHSDQEETRLVIDNGDIGNSSKTSNESNSLQINHEHPGVVSNTADSADEDVGRFSSHSSTCSMSPGSGTVRNGRRNGDDSSDDQIPNGSIQHVDQDLSNTPILTICCGYLSAKLHMDRFYCPGIHQLCVEYNGQFLTPKQFTIVAAKDKQKDWKGAIKINRQPVRVLFERQLLDFYKHDEYCSGRCVSKSYKPLTNGDAISTSPSDLFPNTTFSYNSSGNDQIAVVGRAVAEMAAIANGLAIKHEFDDDHDDEARSQHSTTTRQSKRRSSAGNLDITAMFRNGNEIDFNGSSCVMQNEPIVYWNCVSQLGLFNELTQEIEQQLQVLKTSFGIPELRPKAAKKLSELIRVLDIGDKIQQKLIAKRTYTNAQCALLASELNELKKIAENQEKKQREVKRKSELLDHLIGNLQDQKRRRRDSNVTATPVSVPVSVPVPVPVALSMTMTIADSNSNGQ